MLLHQTILLEITRYFYSARGRYNNSRFAHVIKAPSRSACLGLGRFNGSCLGRFNGSCLGRFSGPCCRPVINNNFRVSLKINAEVR